MRKFISRLRSRIGSRVGHDRATIPRDGLLESDPHVEIMKERMERVRRMEEKIKEQNDHLANMMMEQSKQIESIVYTLAGEDEEQDPRLKGIDDKIEALASSEAAEVKRCVIFFLAPYGDFLSVFRADIFVVELYVVHKVMRVVR